MDDEDIFGWSVDPVYTDVASSYDPASQADFLNFGYESPPDFTQADVSAGAIDDFIATSTPIAPSGWNWGSVIGGVASVITRGVTGSQTITQQTAAQRTAAQTAAARTATLQRQQRNRWLVPALILGGGYLLMKK